MSLELLEVTRGNIVECIHMGDIAVVDSSGTLLYHAGNPDKITYFRSSAKPIQALHLFTSGAYDRFGLSPSEISVICSSHYAEKMHLKTVRSILSKIGLNESNILGGTVTSLNPQYALQLAHEQVELSPIFSDCSGKHSGMLATCVHKGYNLTNYLEPNHPCQQDILANVATVCSLTRDDIEIGIDGCNAPVHALPIKNMALGFARMASPALLPSPLQKGAATVFDSMTSYPEMVSGTGGFCTELIKHCEGTLIGKIGAEGVYCIGIKESGIGIAVKVENGNMNVLPPIIMCVLDQLHCLKSRMAKKLHNFRNMVNSNDLGRTVGMYRPVFRLNKS